MSNGNHAMMSFFGYNASIFMHRLMDLKIITNKLPFQGQIKKRKKIGMQAKFTIIR